MNRMKLLGGNSSLGVALVSILVGACSGTASEPVPSAADVERTQGALKPIGAGVLMDFNTRRDERPWYLIGAMHDAIGGRQDGVCTCVKALNNETCISAAHCFLNCVGPVNQRGPVAPPTITFPGRASIPSGSYGIALPRVYWAGCINAYSPLRRDNDIAVIRFRGAFNTAANQADTVHYGNPNPNVPLASYDVGYVSPNSLGMPTPGFSRYNITVAGYPNLATMPADHRAQNVVFGPYPVFVLSEGYGFLRSATPNLIEYTATAHTAMSGGAVFEWGDDCENCALDGYRLVAIHTGRPVRNGVEVLGPPITHNRGTLLTDRLVDYLWRLAGRP